MGEFSGRLDAEARRVAADADALERVKHRARRRRLNRQVGSGALALAIAGAGFAVAFGAFQGPRGLPRAGPTSSLSPSPSPLNIVVAGSESAQPLVIELMKLLSTEGHDVDAIVSTYPPNSDTTIQFPAWNRMEAQRIREQFLPGAMMDEAASPYHPPPDIRITLGPDYRQLRNDTVQVRVLDAGGGSGATRAAADMLAAAGYDVVEVGELSAEYDVTIVACAPQHDEEGLRILEEFFPKADFRGELPSEDHDVTVYVGPDWAANYD